jgi:subtilisin family serine protease
MMLRPIPRPRYLLLALVFLGAQLAAAPSPAARGAAASDGLNADPPSLSVSVPLGQRLTKSITITNTSSATVTPSIYEAWPAPAKAARAGHAPRTARAALPAQAERLDPALLDDIRAAPDGHADFVVYLRDQADLSAAYDIADWGERGRYVYETLTAWAAGRQGDLRRQLVARGIAFRPLWAVNAVLARGTLADAQSLAGRGDVALIRANHVAALPPAEARAAAPAACNADQPASPICWNIRKIGADRVWREFGVTGQGIVVASIDTGVSYSHPSLGPSYRGYRGPGQYDHNYSWFDPIAGTYAPQDEGYHGTHTMGTIAGGGDGSTSQPAIGVAPGARWISAAGCSAYTCTEADLMAAAQWILAPTALDETRPRPDMRPMIVNNSWSGAGGDSWYAGYTTAWRAAGIFPVFAAGNSYDQTCGSVNSPSDYPDVVGVGATDQNDVIAGFSLFGPTADGRMKPDFSAPGRGIVSAAPDDASYRTLDGTSMAAPHVAGAVALLWSANPSLIGDYDATYALLRDTAQRRSDTRCGDAPGAPNNVYGQGRIDTFAAVARARVDVPWLSAPPAPLPLAAGSSASLSVSVDAARVPAPGTYTARLQLFSGDLSQPPTTIAVTLNVTPAAQQALVGGRVISAEDGAPLDATVAIQGGAQVATDSTGAYTLTVASGVYTLTASASSFLMAQQTISVAGDMRPPDFMLQPDQPRMAIGTAAISATLAHGERPTIAIPIDNRGTRPLHYRVSLPQDEFAAWRSDEPGGPAYGWVDLPAGAASLTLGDNTYTDEIPLALGFPLFSNSYTETVVSSDGVLAFAEPQQGYSGIASRCLPGFEVPFNMIAPFRADLDPSRGGAIRYGTLPGNKTFVLSYENVPLHSGPITETYTFQTLLHDDGRIVFQYKQLAALPNTVSVGIQKHYPPFGQPDRGFQQLACGARARLYGGLAIELRPQTSSDIWLTSSGEEGTVAPEGRQTVGISLAWQRPAGAGPLRSRIVIDSSDRTQPSLTLPVEVALLPAPYERWLGPMFMGRRIADDTQ